MSLDNDNKSKTVTKDIEEKKEVRKMKTGGHTHNVAIPFRQHKHRTSVDDSMSGWTGQPLTPGGQSFDGTWWEGEGQYPDDTPTWIVENEFSPHQHRHTTQQSMRHGGNSGGNLATGGVLIGTGVHSPTLGEEGLYRSGGRAKKANRPVRRNMANGGVAKTKPASRSTCCRGNGGRAASRPTPRPAPRSAPLSGGSRGRGAR